MIFITTQPQKNVNHMVVVVINPTIIIIIIF